MENIRKFIVNFRKGVNKLKSDVSDMLALLKKIDDNQLSVPLFLCDRYAKMPPAAGSEVLAEHIVNVMSAIADVKEKVSKIKLSSTTIEQARELREIKDELGDLKLMLRNVASARSNTTWSYSRAVLGKDLPGRGAARGSSVSFPTRVRSRSFTGNRGSMRRTFSSSGRNATGETSPDERRLSTGRGSALENNEDFSTTVASSSMQSSDETDAVPT